MVILGFGQKTKLVRVRTESFKILCTSLVLGLHPFCDFSNESLLIRSIQGKKKKKMIVKLQDVQWFQCPQLDLDNDAELKLQGKRERDVAFAVKSLFCAPIELCLCFWSFNLNLSFLIGKLRPVGFEPMNLPSTLSYGRRNCHWSQSEYEF